MVATAPCPVATAPVSAATIAAEQITAIILAGGLGTRMGGLDKGLQCLNGVPLAAHVLQRLRQGGGVGPVLINANRHLDDYRALGPPVVCDDVPDQPGPLAGFLSGLQHSQTPYVLTVPCDAPHLPLDLAQRLGAALLGQGADLALVRAPDGPASPPHSAALRPRAQPVFCLMSRRLLPDLSQYMAQGGRQVLAWAQRQRLAWADFGGAGDDPLAFVNLNTLQELHAAHTLPP
jgi:molybdopterin-guanine dinucleotide biosynthesis protein A